MTSIKYLPIRDFDLCQKFHLHSFEIQNEIKKIIHQIFLMILLKKKKTYFMVFNILRFCREYEKPHMHRQIYLKDTVTSLCMLCQTQITGLQNAKTPSLQSVCLKPSKHLNTLKNTFHAHKNLSYRMLYHPEQGTQKQYCPFS